MGRQARAHFGSDVYAHDVQRGWDVGAKSVDPEAPISAQPSSRRNSMKLSGNETPSSDSAAAISASVAPRPCA